MKTAKPRKKRRKRGVDLLIVGIVLTVLGLLLFYAFLSSRIRCRTATDAVIVRVNEKKRFHRGRTIRECTPVFTYTVNGTEYTSKTDRSYSDPKRFSVGQKLTVYTDARHPEIVRYGSNLGFGIAGAVLALAGIFFIVLACL